MLSNENTASVLNRVVRRLMQAPVLELAPKVDCDVCTLSVERPAVAARWSRFKCCTFQPFVANFYCGAHLASGGRLQGVASANARLQALGVVASKGYRDFYPLTPDDERGEDHLCAFYQRSERRCGIWNFRPGECSLHFCGADAKRELRAQWAEKVFAVESAVAQMALVQLGFSPRALATQVECLNALDRDEPDLSVAQAEDLYRGAWNWAETLEAEQVLEWLAFDKPTPGG